MGVVVAVLAGLICAAFVLWLGAWFFESNEPWNVCERCGRMSKGKGSCLCEEDDE